jgi:5-methylcytosine-specific restriction endonuclease McrA
MPSLKTIRPRIGTVSARFAGQTPTGPGRDHQRAAAFPWREWYKTGRWQALHRCVLQRDLYTCQETGVLLIGKHPAPNGPVVDYFKPDRGANGMFWDTGRKR